MVDPNVMQYMTILEGYTDLPDKDLCANFTMEFLLLVLSVSCFIRCNILSECITAPKGMNFGA